MYILSANFIIFQPHRQPITRYTWIYMSIFKSKIIQIVRDIPHGKVMSYGQVALYAGTPRGARQVGWILNQLEETTPVPWWRVVNNQGRITIKGSRFTPQIMKQLLEQEGVIIRSDFTFEIENYRHIATPRDLDKWRLPEKVIEHISKKYLPYIKR